MGEAFENRFKGKCPRNWTREKKLRRERHARVLGDIRDSDARDDTKNRNH